MNIYESITLLGIMVALAAIPSASVALVVARSATLGVANGFAVAAGIVLADLVFVALSILGLSVVAEIMGNLFMILKVLGGLYLLWFGFSLLSTRGMAKITIKKNNSKHSLVASFMAGFFLTLGDIKAIVFYASLLPVFVDLSTIQTPEITVIGLVTIFSVGGVKAVYAIFANKVAACAKRTNMESAARKTAGGLMIGAGGYLIIKA
jgi:threonine/homoserine/homoserine lactone efflux protein